jgi:prepilin-type N-terminal cleavage/methylation domain-containing protein/prepilin-type processing-associated H-X9-DG protein
MRGAAGKRNRIARNSRDPRGCAARIPGGFTLIELLVVVAIIGLLAALLLVSLNKVKDEANSTACISNLKQLQAGWLMYVHDQNDELPPNISQLTFPNEANVTGSWVLGNAKIDTNTDNIRAGVLFPHVRRAEVYRCPADTSTVTGSSSRRTRSYSIELWLNVDVRNGTVEENANSSAFNLRKYTQLVDPPPSQTWVFSDEHANTIDDGIFVIGSPWAFPDNPKPHVPPVPELNFWCSLPGDRHNNGANLSFADGHVEHHTWRFHRTNVPSRKGQQIIKDPDDLADLQWLRRWIPHKPR